FGDRLPLDRDGAGLTVGAAALAAGEELMAIDGREIIALTGDQRLVPLEPVGDVAEGLPERPAAHQGIEAASGGDAGWAGADEAPESGRDAEILLQAVEAAAAGGEEGERGREGRGGLDPGTGPRVSQGGGSLGESKDLLGIGTEACHHGVGSSEGVRRRRARISGFCPRRAWRLCSETRSRSR